MDIDKRNRTELRAYFVKKAIPTESQFADLVNGTLNCKEDGVVRLPGNPLCIEADTSEGKGLLHLYQGFADAAPEWRLGLRHLLDPNDAATAKAGLSITDSSGASRLFIEHSSGNVGLGISEPQARLHVAGGARIEGNLEVGGALKSSLVWYPLTLQNGGAPPAASEPPGYSKDGFGIVRLRGRFNGGTVSTGTVVAQLPAGYTPGNSGNFPVLNHNNTVGRIDISADGKLVVQYAALSSTWVSLEGIQFMAAAGA